jgi:hypothetical protein
MGRSAYCGYARPRESLEGVSQTDALLWIIALLLLELNHLRWIWWEYWDCRKCGQKHRACACATKWIMYL